MFILLFLFSILAANILVAYADPVGVGFGQMAPAPCSSSQ